MTDAGHQSERDALQALGGNFRADFGDMSQEGKRLLAEAIGTFGLVLVSAGVMPMQMAFGADAGRVVAALAPGLVIVALIYALADLSGAHFNPAVTLAFAMRRDFPWARVPGYVAAQLFGAAAAAGLVRAVAGRFAVLGASVPGPHVPLSVVFAGEIVLTALFVVVIVGTASGARIVGHNAAIAVGAFVAAAGLLGSPLGAGSMNPARSLGPDLVAWHFATTWVYVAGQLVGAALGVLLARLLLRGRSSAEIEAAQGSMTEEDEER